MKTVNAQTIMETIAHLCIDANRNLPKDVAAALHQAEEEEPFAPAKDLLSLLTKNEQIARTTQMPICQDTGMAVVFAMYNKTDRKEISDKKFEKRSNIHCTAAYIITDRHNDRSGFRGNFDFL